MGCVYFKKIGLSLVGLRILTPTIITTISCTYSDSFINKPVLTDEQIIKLLAKSFETKEKQEGKIFLINDNLISKEKLLWLFWVYKK